MKKKHRATAESIRAESQAAIDVRSIAGPSPLILSTVFVTGAAVMVVEIVGTRVLSPVFGVGLFVWSSLLSVTMAALAMGYFLGGRLADRRPHKGLLFGTVAIAGALIGLSPLLRSSVLTICDPLGLRLGSLASAAILFGPSLLALGAVGPMAVRLLNRDVAFTGRAAGRVYGVSTVGSLIGSLLTGFVLVPSLEIQQIFLGTSIAVIVLGGLGLVGLSRVAALSTLLIPLLVFALPPPTPPAGFSIVARTDSLYGRLEVVDDITAGIRYLRADQSVIGCARRNELGPVFPYLTVLDEGLRALRPEGKDLLQIGLGIGSLPMVLSQHRILSDVVELDPEVVRMAEDHFGYVPTGETIVADGRTYLRTADRHYDFIVHDTFTGGGTPHHLLSREVLARIRELLRADGLLALNFYGFHEGANAEASALVARTLQDVFPHVRCFRDRPPSRNPDRPANLIFFASNEPLSISAAQSTDTAGGAWRDWEVLRDVAPGAIVTDGWNPLERMQLPVAREYFLAMRRLLPSTYWYQ